MRTARLKAALEHFIREVWDLGNADAAGRHFADAYTIHHDPGDPWEGRTLDLDGYKERVRLSRAPFPDQAFDTQRMCADGDAVAMTWLWRATHLADFPGFPATGRTVRMSGATTYLSPPRTGSRGTGRSRIGSASGVSSMRARRGRRAPRRPPVPSPSPLRVGNTFERTSRNSPVGLG